MKKILITGSGGLIGSEAVEFFCERGYEVYGIDNNYRKFFFGDRGSVEWRIEELFLNKNYKHFNFDITKYSEVENLIKNFGPFELIIHTAAQPSHDWACKAPLIDFSVNAVGTMNLLESYRLFSPESVFIFTSTNKVYGDRPNTFNYIETENRYTPDSKNNLEYGFDETLSIDNCLHSIFGSSKISADIMVQEYGKYFNLKTVVFRGGCLTGKKHSSVELHGFLSYLCKCCIDDIPYNIYGYKGKQVRDNIHSSDLINAFNCWFESPKDGGTVYNIGGGVVSNCSVLEAINLIETATNKKMKVLYKNENRIGDHIWWISDTRKFQTDFPNWKQNYTIEKIIESFI